MTTKRVTSPEEAVSALAQVAITARQTFCIDEPPLPILLSKITWSAEEIVLKNNRSQCVIDGFYRMVFSEHQLNPSTLTWQELRDTQAALLDYLGDEPNERLMAGIKNWNDLLETLEHQIAA